jgi:adenosylcobyric acid synthase
MTARGVFVGGTSSNAGKSWMVTALCAWLRDRGVRVAPFKAQNMSNHAFPCRDGGEIGRAQLVQAEACGLEPEPAMNPILLKPNGDGTSQVVVNGRVWKTMSAAEYYEHHDRLLSHVLQAYASLAERFDVVVVEGAGSVSELNLRHVDLVNLGLVARLGLPWVLVADIERGGVFASVLGTVGLLTAGERHLFRGFAINKFRGDPALFESGVRLLEEGTASRCLGVFPYAEDIDVDAEDSLAVRTRAVAPPPPGARLAIVRLPSLSNPTDFRLLAWADWIQRPSPTDYDFIVLPGSKHTIRDLQWLRETGLAEWIVRAHGRGATIVGVCGGFQMLGRSVSDPAGVESRDTFAHGLGLVPADTLMAPAKTTRVIDAVTAGGAHFRGYEIHLGRTEVDGPCAPFARLATGDVDGYRGDRVIGTYLHGAFEDAAVCREVFGVEVSAPVPKAETYRRLSAWFGAHAREVGTWLGGPIEVT